jgi:hypothetical protein
MYSRFIKRIEKAGDHTMVKIGRAVLGQLTQLLLYKHTVYDKDAGEWNILVASYDLR